MRARQGFLTTRTSPPTGDHTARGKLHVGEAGLQVLEVSNKAKLLWWLVLRKKCILMLVTTVRMTLFRSTVTERGGSPLNKAKALG